MSSFEKIQNRVSDFIYGQFHEANAQRELEVLGPDGFSWVERTKRTLDVLLPALPVVAQSLIQKVPDRLNSALSLDALVREGERHVKEEQSSKDWLTKVQEITTEAKELIGHIESQQISSAIQRFIMSDEGIGRLVYSNGNSIYPDIILKEHSYKGLPFQNRRAPVDGPCLQGKQTPRPSNVPDGCELKTNRGNRIRVDAHGAHAGLHIGVTWEFIEEGIHINGVWAGYVKISDHRESGRNVAVTTVKYSFGHDLFVSLFGD